MRTGLSGQKQVGPEGQEYASRVLGIKNYSVRKHFTGGLLCAVLDLSGILCSLLIPEYSGIKRRGKHLLGLPSLVFLYGDKYPLPSCEPFGKSDCLQPSLSLIWIAYVF